jgi:hypothetical protein
MYHDKAGRPPTIEFEYKKAQRLVVLFMINNTMPCQVFIAAKRAD